MDREKIELFAEQVAKLIDAHKIDGVVLVVKHTIGTWGVFQMGSRTAPIHSTTALDMLTTSVTDVVSKIAVIDSVEFITGVVGIKPSSEMPH